MKKILYWIRLILWGWQMPLLIKLGLISPPPEPKVVRCTRCYEEYTAKEFDKMECCTACGSTAQPQLIEQDVIIKINWQELRILVEFALRSSVRGESRGVLVEIIKRLAENRPVNSPPLTLEDEFKEQRRKP